MTKIIKKSVIEEIQRVSDRYRDEQNNSSYTYVITLPNREQYGISFAGGRLITDLDSLPACCYHDRAAVYKAIDEERQYQIDKWGDDHPQSLPGFLLILQREVNEAIDGWMKNSSGRDAPLNEVLQVAAVAVACLERYGCNGITTNVNDIPPEQQ